MAVVKYLNRITNAADAQIESNGGNNQQKAQTMHGYTSGISSDPLTHFACAFSALIHDVDHVSYTFIGRTSLLEVFPD